MARFATGSVTSRDGTRIGYRRAGQGLPVILLHGGMQGAQHLTLLAEGLVDSFAVYIPDRRGRGLSDAPYEICAGLSKQCEDLEALLLESGAHRVFGLSSGGIIAIHGALRIPAIQKVAVYEPALSMHGSSPTHWLDRYEREIQQRRLAAALVTALKGIQISRFFEYMPRWVLVPLLKFAIRHHPVNAGDIPLELLIPTMKCDVRLVLETEDTVPAFANLQADALLLGGSKGPAYLQCALDALERTLPHARRVVLRGLDHLGPSNEGNPNRVAKELRRFFIEPSSAREEARP
ncbi:MAG TPA: alpha/beta hydrolase [Bryobacteraceae bacterium]|nr:alpha/beta hydrolase [Bryobacteraceae bacterium]